MKERSLDDEDVEQLKHKMRTERLSSDCVNLLAQIGYAPALKLFAIKPSRSSRYWEEIINFEKALNLLTHKQRRLLCYACAKRLIPLMKWHENEPYDFLRKVYRSKDPNLANNYAHEIKTKNNISMSSDNKLKGLIFCVRGMSYKDCGPVDQRFALKEARDIWSTQKEIENPHDERQVQADSIAKLFLAQLEK